jgi:hypothetical protein
VTYLKPTALADYGKIEGQDYEKARYYPENEKFPLNFSENAEHLEIFYAGSKDSRK